MYGKLQKSRQVDLNFYLLYIVQPKSTKICSSIFSRKQKEKVCIFKSISYSVSYKYFLATLAGSDLAITCSKTTAVYNCSATLPELTTVMQSTNGSANTSSVTDSTTTQNTSTTSTTTQQSDLSPDPSKQSKTAFIIC